MYLPRTAGLVPVLLLCLLSAGCTGVQFIDGFLATPTPTPLPPPVTVTHTTVAATTVPPPVTTIERPRALPPERKVNLVLTKDRPTSEIHLLYQGGPGELYLTRITMRVYTSETVYQEYIMSNGRKPLPGDEIVAPGTRSGDRCEVFVISAGTRYKVIDELVYGGMYY
jgi:hypothetical protein